MFLPIRFCKKNIGPLELNFIKITIAKKNGEHNIMQIKADKKSKRFLNTL